MNYHPIVGYWFFGAGTAVAARYVSYGLIGTVPAKTTYRFGAEIFLDMSLMK